MGIAFTNGPVAFSNTLRIDTGAHLIADLDALLLSVNWTHAAIIPSGFIYKIESPQSYVAYVTVQDVGAAGQGPGQSYDGHLIFQVADNTSGLNAGIQHWIGYGWPGSTYYEAVANQCQLFLGLPSGETGPLFGAAESVALGIPYVAVGSGSCVAGVNPAETDTIWWSCGSGENEGRGPDFRTAWAPLQNFSYSLNGVTVIAGPSLSQASGMLNVFPLIPTDLSAVSVVKYGSLDPLQIDPLLGWNYAMYGQVWDAFLSTAFGTLDNVFSTSENNSGGGTSNANWIVWSFENDGPGIQGTYYGTLCLLTAPPMSNGGGGGGGGAPGFAYAY
jgi:hypothetical protein